MRSFNRSWVCVMSLCVALLLVAPTPHATAQEPLFASPGASAEQEVERLIEVLQSDASLFEKGQACKRLAFLGDDRCVPVLAELLGDKAMSHHARHALEAIPSPAADEALRSALGKVKGRQLLGVINSIGVRRDAQAVQPLTPLLKGQDRKTAAAAAAALGNIATPEAVALLAEAIPQSRGGHRLALADASLRAAEVLAASGKTADARKIYESLAENQTARHVRLAAALGILRTEPEATVAERFTEYLTSNDDVKVEAAIYASPERGGAEVTRALAAALQKAPEATRMQLLDALRVRGDEAVVPQIAAALEKGSADVKVAALMAIGQIGNHRSVPLLINVATSNDGQVAATAIESLSKLRGKEIDDAVLEQLSKSRGTRQRVVAIVVGRRGVAAATPVLLALLNSAEEPTRIAVLEALGQTVSEQDFVKLLDHVPAAKSEDEKKATLAAVDSACRRMPNANAVAQAVAERLKSWPEADRPALLRVLGAVGGAKSLEIVAQVAEEGTPELQDAATRVLGEWMSPDAAPYLYQIAAGNGKYKTRALRGYLRIARQLNLPSEERLAMCRKALEIAERAEERQLALEVMKRAPSAEAVELAVSLIEDGRVRDQAVETAVFIGEKIKDSNPAAAKAAGEKALKAKPNGDLAERARALTSP